MSIYLFRFHDKKIKVNISNISLAKLYVFLQKKFHIKTKIVLEQNHSIVQSFSSLQPNKEIIVRIVYIVLDLDETILHSLHYHELNGNEHEGMYGKIMEDDDEENQYIVFARPHIMEFMDYIFKHYKVVVWTAASEDYAKWVVKNILSLSKTSETPVHRDVQLLLSCDHCDISNEVSDGKHKDLDLLYDEFRLHESSPDIFHESAIFVLFDDSSSAQKSNPGTSHTLNRCVPIPPFELTEDQFDVNDDVLLQIKKQLKQSPEKLFSKQFSINI